MKKVLSIFFILVLVVGGWLPFFSVLPISVQASSPSYIQTIDIPVESDPTKAKPKVVWYQLDNGWFRANYTRADGTQSYKDTPNAGTDWNPVPQTELITDTLNWLNYQTTGFREIENSTKRHHPSAVTKLELESFKFNDDVPNPSFKGIDWYFNSNDPWKVQVITRTGHEFNYTNNGVFDTRYGTNYPKMWFEYETPIEIKWRGVVQETKQIRVVEDSTLKVGEQKYYRAEVRTKSPGQDQWGPWVDVSTRPETEWYTNKGSVATVNQSGRVTAHSKGEAIISTRWRSGEYDLVDAAKATVVDDDTSPPPPLGDCSVIINQPSLGGQRLGSVMNADATGVIRADHRGNEQFDVLQGIPTSESLYVNVFGREYLFQNKFRQMSGTVTYTVPVSKTYELTWQEEIKKCTTKNGKEECQTEYEPHNETETVIKNYTVQRPYSYWIIENLEVFGLESAIVNNYALPNNESVTLYPNGYTPPNVNTSHSTNVNDHVFPSACSHVDLGTETIDGGNSRPSVPNENFQSEAEKAVGQNEVKNDRVVFNGQTIMDDSRVTTNGPTPRDIPSPGMIGTNVLYESNLVISNTKTNRSNAPSSGTIQYNLVEGVNEEKSQILNTINGLNPVTVHTPVVVYADVSDDREHNQRTQPDLNRRALILDRPFTIRFPTSGQHRNILGYGNRDYAKYIQAKQVRFPFDVYHQTQFVPANTWINIPVPQTEVEFFLPVWVNEGAYDVLFRSIAINAPSGFTTQPNANTDLQHHVATDVIPVDVIGRLYDFRVTDIADYNWENVFRMNRGRPEHTGNYYWVGDRDIDGQVRGNQPPFILPIRAGSHPNFKNISVKTGYHFKFDLKTKGNMFGPNDGVRITPSFYFVNKDGSNRRKVDLYYQSDTNAKKFIKIGSSEDQQYRYVTLNHRLRNVPTQQLIDTAEYYYDHSSPYGYNTSNIFKSTFIDEYINRYSKNKTLVGTYSWMILPHQLRTFIGPKINEVPTNASVPRADAIAHEQQWYGEYSLPAKVYVVEEGTDIAAYARVNRLTDNSPIFLKNGYIVVNFNIETIRNGDVANPYLQYIYAPLTNQWAREGFATSFIDPYGNVFNGQHGDVIYYHADQSSYNDFNSTVTH